MKEDGILVGLATGRGPGFVQPFMDNLGLDFAVTYNGQYILTHDKVLYQNQLPKSTVYNLIRYATKHRREISLGTSTELVGSNIISMGTSKFGQMVSRIVPKSWAKMVERSFKSLIRRFKPQSMETLKTIMREPVYQVGYGGDGGGNPGYRGKISTRKDYTFKPLFSRYYFSWTV